MGKPAKASISARDLGGVSAPYTTMIVSLTFHFVAGRYRRPRVEDRVLLFIDMESSTVIAERLGEVGFLDFLNRFVADVTESIVAQCGAIHKYVGDEIIVTWPLAAGLRDGHCVHACFDALEQLDDRAKAYIRDFGLRANFRAALHCGPVAIGELGTIKMEIAFLGDTMNTAARLQQACRDTGQRVLASAALVNRLAALPPGIAKRSIGRLPLRGKENEIELYALTAAVSATSASGEITVLSSRDWCSHSVIAWTAASTPSGCSNRTVSAPTASSTRKAPNEIQGSAPGLLRVASQL